MVFCGDCGSKLWNKANSKNKNIRFFSCSNYKKDFRGTCETRHYIRADALEQVVTMELKRLTDYLRFHEGDLVKILSEKTSREIAKEKKSLETELQKSIKRSEQVAVLYERLYEDNISGKVTDEWFMHLSHTYDVERMKLKTKISELHEKINTINSKEQDKNTFLKIVRKFMNMDELSASLVRELIDHIDVYEREEIDGKKIQRIVIYYKFVGNIELPANFGINIHSFTLRKGVLLQILTHGANKNITTLSGIPIK